MLPRRSQSLGLVAILLLAAFVGTATAQDVTYEISCGTTALLCNPTDYLKITASSEKGWPADVTVQDRDSDNALPSRLAVPLETSAKLDRVLNLRQWLHESARSDSSVLQTLYRKPAAQIPLQLKIGKSMATHAFTLDLTPAYKDGTLGLMLNPQRPSCRAPAQPGASDTAKADSGTCRIGDIIDVRIDNLAQWAKATGREVRNLVLYLNEVPMSGVPAMPGSYPDSLTKPQIVSYRLIRDLAIADHAKAWRTLLESGDDEHLALNVGVGADSQRWVYSPGPGAPVLELPRSFWAPFGIGSVTLVLLIVLGGFSSTLRAFSGVPKSWVAFEAKSDADKDALALLAGPVVCRTLRAPYSMSMVLMALWLMIVSFSFFVMFWFTRSGDLINPTALALMGFSAGSFVLAKVIDTPSDAQRVTDGQVDDALATALSKFTAADVKTADAVLTGIKAARAAGLISSKSALRDLFSEKAVARFDLHRLQLFAFSLFYAGVFLWSLNRILALPDFSSTTLGLLGISTASYLGFKFAATS